jgi:hypothetical protein
MNDEHSVILSREDGEGSQNAQELAWAIAAAF